MRDVTENIAQQVLQAAQRFQESESVALPDVIEVSASRPLPVINVGATESNAAAPSPFELGSGAGPAEEAIFDALRSVSDSLSREIRVQAEVNVGGIAVETVVPADEITEELREALESSDFQDRQRQFIERYIQEVLGDQFGRIRIGHEFAP